MATDVQHEFWVDDEPPALKMANDDDGFYIQTFRDRGEVESFIEKMRAEAAKAFGPNLFIGQP